MRKLYPRVATLAAAIVLSLLLLAPAAAQSGGTLTTPDDFAGFPIGSDGNLLRWEKIVEFFRLTASKSDRVLFDELGKTTNGNPFVMATISSPKNLARLDEIKATQHLLADPRKLSGNQAEKLSWESPILVLMSCNLHSTEIASSQMALKVLYRLATEDSPWVRNVLDHAVLLLVPSLNPDGQIIVTDWNNRVRGTENVWSPIPQLYHPYTGHDNNRDAFLMTQVEARLINRVLYQDWLPQVFLDQHQMGQTGMRVFVPPFTNPINPNVNPVIWTELGMFGLGMFNRLHAAGYSGNGYNIAYTSWWQGGFIRAAWYHNIVGLLTEVASANLASPVYQKEAKLWGKPDRSSSSSDWAKEREKDPAAPAPPPSMLVPLANYPQPWLGGKWTLSDVIDRQLTIAYSLLETAANNRVQVIENQIGMGRKAVELGKQGGPYAFVFPAEQHDPGALYQLLEALHFNGVEIQRAKDDFEAGGQTHPEGSYVVAMAQPFRNYVVDLMSPHDYPDPKDMPPGAMRSQPYDSTTWTMPLQMGVEMARVEKPFEAPLEQLGGIALPSGNFNRAGKGQFGFLIRPEPNNSAKALNRLLRQGADVRWTAEEWTVAGTSYPPGTLWVRGLSSDAAAELVESLGLTGSLSTGIPPVPTQALTEPRVALYQPWTASMDEGWTRWLLEQYEFRSTPVHDADLQSGSLADRWDAVILPADRDEKSIIDGHVSKSVPEEYRGGIGEKGRAAIREFVAAGGTLITMGDSTDFALRTFALPLKNALDGVGSSEFSCPGSFLRVLVDNRNPIAYGMPAEASAVFKDGSVFEAVPEFSYTSLRAVARYPGTNPLQSGWIRGDKHLHNRIAAAEVGYKKGRIVLIGFRPQHRAQSNNTFKLLFNSIYLSAAGPADTVQLQVSPIP